MRDDSGQLPGEPADKVTRPFLRFFQIESMAGIALFCSAFIAIAMANSPWSNVFLSFWETTIGVSFGDWEISRSLRHWINDGLMTLFFFVIALELKRELVLGELRDPRLAALPLAAALGGILVPAGVFLFFTSGEPGMAGWGTVMSTDTAFVIGCLALLGSRIPMSLRVFLLSLAIFDDIGAILVVAIGYGERLNLVALLAAGLCLILVLAIRRVGIRTIPIYVAIGGALWIAFDLSGIHATITGVILGLMTPARSWVSDIRLHAILDRVTAYPPGDHWSGNTVARVDLRRAGIATREALSPLERLELTLHPWVAFIIMPLFAMANAGVSFVGAEINWALTMSVLAAFVVGKPVGIISFSVLAVLMRLGRRPKNLSWDLLAGGSMLAGIGFTMAVFIADLAFSPDLLGSVKVGILSSSVISASIGLALLFWRTSVRRQ